MPIKPTACEQDQKKDDNQLDKAVRDGYVWRTCELVLALTMHL
jgi:hypothetical protein